VEREIIYTLKRQKDHLISVLEDGMKRGENRNIAPCTRRKRTVSSGFLTRFRIGRLEASIVSRCLCILEAMNLSTMEMFVGLYNKEEVPMSLNKTASIVKC
jgi:hypothetical protein